MANQIPSDIGMDDAALLAPVMIGAAKSHASVLGRYLTKKLDAGWQGELTRRADALDAALEAVAKEELETRELSKEIDAILARLPAWKRHILSLGNLAYDKSHPKYDQYQRDLGRGKPLSIASIGPARNFLQEVVPEVAAHRKALLAAGGEAEKIDLGAAWAEKLAGLKAETTREKREDNEARAAAGKAYDELVVALGWIVDAANASEFAHPQTEQAVAQALEDGYRKIRQRNGGKEPPNDPPGEPPVS